MDLFAIVTSVLLSGAAVYYLYKKIYKRGRKDGDDQRDLFKMIKDIDTLKKDLQTVEWELKLSSKSLDRIKQYNVDSTESFAKHLSEFDKVKENLAGLERQYYFDLNVVRDRVCKLEERQLP